MILILNLMKPQLIRLYNLIKKKTCLSPKVEHDRPDLSKSKVFF